MTRILLDIDHLEQTGVVTPQLALTLRANAVRDTGSAAINILLAFGAIAIAAGILALHPTPGSATIFGAGFIFAGWLVERTYRQNWGKFGSILMIVGALVLAAGVGALIDQPFIASLCAALILGFVSVLAASRLLAALVPLALAAAIGGSTGYWHACYEISVREPTLTIILFSVLAWGAWQFAKRNSGVRQSLALVFCRMSIILVNFGFWIGALFGDTPGRLWRDPVSPDYFDYGNPQIPALAFVVIWALILILAGAWGARHHRRFMVNTAAVFMGILLYTAWFEYVGLEPVSVILGGVATVAFGLGLWRYNRQVLLSPPVPAKP